MPTAITHDVKVKVDTDYIPQQSNPLLSEFFFAYHISIENQGEHTIQLLRRQWFIFDALQPRRMVEGEGVVGLKPIIPSGKKHNYSSGCLINGQFGRMSGNYLFVRLVDDYQFYVEIPAFDFIYPVRLN
jgi:ApaG protein